jgi:hypothetical protein
MRIAQSKEAKRESPCRDARLSGQKDAVINGSANGHVLNHMLRDAYQY